MREKLFILSAICLILFAAMVQADLKTTSWHSGIESPEWKGLSLNKTYSQKLFPNLVEKKENQFSFSRRPNGLYPGTIMNNKTWDKVKGAWNGPVVELISKVTGDSNNNVFVWTIIHSFFDSITDAKAHSRGKTKYFRGDADWHIWKNFRDFSATMIVLNFSRRIFIEKITLKEAARDLICIGLLRAVVHNTTMKIVKGGFSAYNDPKYNKHNITYWRIKDGKLTDGYIATGRWSTPLVDVGWLTGFIFLKTWKFD